MSSQPRENGNEKQGPLARVSRSLLVRCRKHPRWATFAGLALSLFATLTLLSVIFRRALLAWCLEWGGGHFLKVPVKVDVQQLGWNRATLSLNFPSLDLTLSPVFAQWRLETDAFDLETNYTATEVLSPRATAQGVDFALKARFPSQGVALGSVHLNVEKLKTPWAELGEFRWKAEREKGTLFTTLDIHSPPTHVGWKGEGQGDLSGPLEGQWEDWKIQGQLRSEGKHWMFEEGAVVSPKKWQGVLGTSLPFRATWGGGESIQWVWGPVHNLIWETAALSCDWQKTLACSLGEGGWVGVGQWKGRGLQSLTLTLDPATSKGSVILGALSYPFGDSKLQVASLNFEIQRGEKGIQGTLFGMDIAHSGELWYPQQLKGELRQEDQNLLLEGGLEDMLSTRWFNFKSLLSLETGRWTFNVDETWDFASGADFSNLSDLFSQRLILSGGTIQLKSEMEILPKFKSSTQLSLVDLFGTFDGIPYTGLKGSLELSNLSPLKFRRPAKFTLESIGEKLPLTEVRLDIREHRKGFMVERAETHIGTGKVWALPFVVDSSGEFETDVSLSHIDMGWVLEKAQMETLQGSGQLQGILPIQWKKDYLYIRNGKLKDDGGQGWIQYRDGTLTVDESVDYLDQFQSLLAQGQQALVFKALDNFFFKDFSLIVNRNPEKGLDATLAIEGKNPDLAKGQPFKFNIALTGQVENAVKQSLMRAMMDPEAFTEQFQNGQ